MFKAKYLIICMLVIAIIGWIVFTSKSSLETQQTASPVVTAQIVVASVSSSPKSSVLVVSNKIEPATKYQQVPFVAQAPFGDWKDPRQQDGCEEASVLMAMRWVQGRGLTKEEALAEIFAMADYEEKNYGSYRDTSAADTLERIVKGYFGYTKARVVSDITTKDIKAELAKGHVVITPVESRQLHNPYYSGEGADRHMIVIRGYNAATDEFITNDPGTRRGDGYPYKSSVLQRALRDYQSGDHAPIIKLPTAMIVIQK